MSAIGSLRGQFAVELNGRGKMRVRAVRRLALFLERSPAAVEL